MPTHIRMPQWITHLGLGSDRAYFIENMSVLASSGMSVLAAFAAIGAETRTKRMRAIIAGISDDVATGSPLWRALEKAELFPAHTISLIRVGEQSGRLSANLKIVAAQTEKDRIFRSKLRSAMLYPVFVLVLMLIVGIGIAWFILPKLALVFSSLHMQLPLITKELIAFGAFLSNYGVVAVPVFLFTLLLIGYFCFSYPKTRFIGQAIVVHLPGVGQLVKQVELARFGYLLGTLLDAGLSVGEALDSLEHASTFPRYKKLYAHLRAAVAEGNSFQKSFASFKGLRGLMPMPVVQLVVAGEQSGHLVESLLRIGQSYEEKSETTTKNLSVILEPILLVIVWLGVVGVALAVILPIYNLIGDLNTH